MCAEGLSRTETRNPHSMRLGELDATDVIELMNAEEHAALVAVERATKALASAAERVADVYGANGRVFLLGAGTSGRLVAMEAAELPPTFGVDETRFVPLIASGATGGSASITRHEDDTGAAPHALAGLRCSRADAVIGVAASGTTPFVLAGIAYARSVGAWTCGIANNPGTPLLKEADLAVLLDTGPEVLTGSTRLKAGTSQKLALNRITTAAMTLAGKVVSNLMVEVKPGTAKLRDRCVRIVRELTGASEELSRQLLEAVDWDIRSATELHRSAEERDAVSTTEET